MEGEWLQLVNQHMFFELIFISRSLHNVRIERLWRDVRKDSLEAFRQVFMHLEEIGKLDMENPHHRSSLFLVFRRRIQQSLDRTRDAWNLHGLRTERRKIPVAIYELSREKAINGGYWTGDGADPGDPIEVANDEFYGMDGEAPLPPAAELHEDPDGTQDEALDQHTGVSVNSEEELRATRDILGDFDVHREDGNWGIDVYLEAIQIVEQEQAA